MEIKKIFKGIQRRYIIAVARYINAEYYMELLVKYYKKEGMDIGNPKFIAQDVYIDSHNYSLIHIGDNVTISREVMLLSHDYCLHTVYYNLNLSNNKCILEKDKKDKLLIEGEIHIGKNTFIGARAVLLFGTHIGENVIVGAGSVVKGRIPNNSIVVGNPCRILKRTSELLEKIIKDM